MAASMFQEDFMTNYEAEKIIEQLHEIDIREYGSKQWVNQHEYLDRLNIQAHKNAVNSTDEFIMDLFVTLEKIDFLIYDLLVTESWKLKVYPHLKKHLAGCSSIKGYITLYHEASLANLLEVIMFHRTACESSDDALVELVDYCYRKLVWLTNYKHPKTLDTKETLKQSNEQDLERQNNELEFSISMISLSIIRFISDHIKHLALPIANQLLDNNDIVMILIPILEDKPWIRYNQKGEKEKYEDQRWEKIPPQEEGKITKLEAQIWLTIYNLLMQPDSSRRYEVTTHRKSNLLRLRKYLNEVLLDQIPALTGLLRSLEEMSIQQEATIASKNPFIIQTLPEIRTRIMKGKNWQEIALYQAQNIFTNNPNEEKEEMKKLMALYNSDAFEQFMDEPKCGNCGQKASQRCSKCKNMWYCSRDCQVRAWKGHKELCDLIFKGSKEEEVEKKGEVGEVKKVLIEEIQ